MTAAWAQCPRFREVVQVAAVVLVTCAATVSAQAPTPVERLSFRDAIDRAITNNPSVSAAASGILRAEGLLRQARAATLLLVTGNVTTTTLNTGVSFGGSTVAPQNQVTSSLTVDMPVVAAADWARRAQARDSIHVAELGVEDTKRQVALAAADAYLSIIVARRVVEGIVLARDTAKAHFDLATQLEQQGTGSRLNALRAEQQFSIDRGLVEVASLAVYRAQEALGVLVAATGPVDATEEPRFEVPADGGAPANVPSLLPFRADLRLLTAQVDAAQHVLHDSSKDWWPSVNATFIPQSVYPAPFFSTANSWRLLLQGHIPIYDSGQRTAFKIERQAAVDLAQSTLTGAVTTASSQVRAAREAIASGERSLAAARAAADQAAQVVNIVNISFRAGAATNIEVIDAERTARDTDTAVAAAEDTLRRARLDLLAALGRFP